MEQIRGIKIAYGADWADGRLILVRCVRGQSAEPGKTILDAKPPILPSDGLFASDLSRTDVILSGVMSARESFARWIHTPLNSPEKALRILPSLLDVQIPFPLEVCEYTAAAVRRAENRAVDILAVAARREDLHRRLNDYTNVGLEPEILDHEGLALWTQSLHEAPLERDAARVVAYLGLENSTLVIGHGPEQGFTGSHGVRLGVQHLLDPNNGEEAARQFALRAQQVVRAQIPERIDSGTLQWFWCGPGTEDNTAMKRLEEALETLGPPRFRVHKQAVSFLARALAFRALGGQSLPCNLRGSSAHHPKTALRAHRLHHRAIISLAAAGIALGMTGFAWQTILQTRDRAAQSELTATARGASGLSVVPRGQEVLVTQRALKEQEDLYTPFQNALQTAHTELLNRILLECSRLGIRIETLSLRADSATIRGSVTDWNHGDAPIALFKESGYDAEIERQDAGADERVHFTIKARRSGGRGS